MTEREKFEAMMTEFANKPESSFETPYEDVDANAYWAIWQASRRAALEEAADVCNGIEVDRWNLYKGRPPYSGTEDGRANSYVEGESDGAGKCAAAIRALTNGDKI